MEKIGFKVVRFFLDNCFYVYIFVEGGGVFGRERLLVEVDLSVEREFIFAFILVLFCYSDKE